MHIEPTDPAPALPWVARGCTVGSDSDRCGQPIVGAHAVGVAPDPWHLDELHHGLLLLCRRHYAALTAPPPEDPCSPPPSSPSPPH